MKTEKPDAENARRSERVVKIIENHSQGAMAAMIAIPIPGADIGATMAVWGSMIVQIGKVYGYEVDLEDAKRLSSHLFKSVVLTTAAWFASAKTASFLCKFIPGAGTMVAYGLDILIAGIGAKGITSRLGTAAALYFMSGKTMGPKTMAEHVKNVADPQSIRSALGLFGAGVGMEGMEDYSDWGQDDHLS